MSHQELTDSLGDAFNVLADEVQGLNDRRTVLEHKLRFAHEQLQFLADKYAPATPEIAETLAKLQLPAHTSVVDEDQAVPLLRRNSPRSQHQIALVIRDGRRVANQLASIGQASKTTDSTRDTVSQTSEDHTSMSTALEQDFTVEGKKGNLQCPFQKAAEEAQDEHAEPQDGAASQAHKSTDHNDHTCAAMYEESNQSASGAGKCPIRYMDQHSPEDIANYVEAHKHELPRSHAVCLRRYQRNEDQIKKLDSKYGNIVSMIEGLGQLHQPMLPEENDRQRRPSEIEKASNERVQTWAKAVTVTTDPKDVEEAVEEDDDERLSHFDRPLKEVRLGESPSRPWGIHVPVYELPSHGEEHPFSPPPAPVRMPSPVPGDETPVKQSGGKCPFDHTKLAALADQAARASKAETNPPQTPPPQQHTPFISTKEAPPQAAPSHLAQPAFINPTTAAGNGGNTPQMVFNGPVFIGYPVEQAIQIMNSYRNNGSAATS